MKHLLKVAVAVFAVIAAISMQAKAQTVVLTGLGSSAYFLESGLGANYSSGLIKASCVWSENTSTVTAKDTSVSPAATDTGNAWVAWTTGTGGSCAAPASDSKIYAYLQTDSVVGNRCLFNSSTCKITYPNTDPASAGLILGTSSEVNLPTAVANLLNAATVNFAGSDIRPEDAEFAITRATTACNTAIVTGSQYRGLGYSNGNQIGSYNYNQAGTGSYFNVVKFTLPSSFSVTIVGATPIVVAANGTGISAGNISAQTLADLLDGTYSYTGQVSSSPAPTGSALWVYLREPLSGTYNTMEYNIPNTTTAKTSQDVGVNQPSAQVNCSGTVPKGLVAGSSPAAYDLNISTTSGGARQRQIGTGAELKAIVTNANSNSLGYGFWSVANFAGFTAAAAPHAKYLEIGGVDPLLKSGVAYTGTIPVSGTTELSDVDLHTTADGTYPIWSLLRLVTVTSAATTAAENLASATDDFVSFGSTNSRPDFVTPVNMNVVRSHFTPPGIGFTATLINGDSQLNDGLSACSNLPESGGDVGGVILSIYSPNPFNGHEDDNDWCSTTGNNTNGQTGLRN